MWSGHQCLLFTDARYTLLWRQTALHFYFSVHTCYNVHNALLTIGLVKGCAVSEGGSTQVYNNDTDTPWLLLSAQIDSGDDTTMSIPSEVLPS